MESRRMSTVFSCIVIKLSQLTNRKEKIKEEKKNVYLDEKGIDQSN